MQVKSYWKRRVCQIIDVSCPFDTRIAEKEREKIDYYQDLKVEYKRCGTGKTYLVFQLQLGHLGQ